MYSFQARLGAMDGVFLAYHNTARLFGFQYIPMEEMEERLFGGKNRGDRVFDKCIRMLEVIADEVTKYFPQQVSFRALYLCKRSMLKKQNKKQVRLLHGGNITREQLSTYLDRAGRQ